MEVARKLAREMDEHKTVSVSRIYVPNEYAVYLSPEDRERFAGLRARACDELCGYLLEHARRERFALRLAAVDRVPHRRAAAARRVRHPGAARAASEPAEDEPSPGDAGHTMVYSAADRMRGPVEERARAPPRPRGCSSPAASAT